MPRNATRPEELLSTSEAIELSGLEFMQAILDGTVSQTAMQCFAGRQNSMSPTRWVQCMGAGTARYWIQPWPVP